MSNGQTASQIDNCLICLIRKCISFADSSQDRASGHDQRPCRTPHTSTSLAEARDGGGKVIGIAGLKPTHRQIMLKSTYEVPCLGLAVAVSRVGSGSLAGSLSNTHLYCPVR